MLRTVPGPADFLAPTNLQNTFVNSAKAASRCSEAVTAMVHTRAVLMTMKQLLAVRQGYA